jgi:hypothetical protein
LSAFSARSDKFIYPRKLFYHIKKINSLTLFQLTFCSAVEDVFLS